MIESIPRYIPGLKDDEAQILFKLGEKLAQKRVKNQLLTAYYDGHRVFQDLGISIPPQLKNVKAALGWPAKAVRALARKHVFEGFSLDGAPDAFELDELLVKNRFELDLIQGVTSAYKHSCSFLTTTKGDTSRGEPEVVVQARDAEWTTALWDSRRREITAFLAVTGADELGAVTSLVFMLPGQVITVEKDQGKWSVDRRSGIKNRVLAEMLVHDPQLNRPFGTSRISREVRYLTDAAIRTLARTETSAEFFTSPQRYALGVEEDAFSEEGRWSAIIGRILALQTNEDGEVPTVGQFPQLSMDPHLSMYRQLAQNFCSATGLPQSAVGLFADNPASAEAMQTAEAELAESAEYQWLVFKPSLVRIAQNLVMLRDGESEPRAESWKLRVNHKPARYVSPQASSDFTVKAVGAVPKIGETTEALRGLGYSAEQIEGMQAEWRRGESRGLLDQILAARQSQTDPVVESDEEVE